MTRRNTDHCAHCEPVPDTYEDLNARRCAAQTTRYGTVLDRHGRPTGWLYMASVGERPYFVRGTVTTEKRRNGSDGWRETASWNTIGSRIYSIQVGDRIRFRVIALWRDRPTAWRVVKSVDPIEVRLGGCGDYIVRPDEVLEVNPS